MGYTYLNLLDSPELSSNLNDFNYRNKALTAKLLRQGYRYFKLRKAFSEFYRRHSAFLEKYSVSLKTLLQQGITVFVKSFQQMQDSCQTDWNFWQDKINFCRTGGLSVIKLLSLFARNHRTFVRQTEIFCRTDWKFASFVRQSCSFRKDCITEPEFYGDLVYSKFTCLSMTLTICYTLLYVFGQTGLSKQCRPWCEATFVASYQGLHCLPLIQLFLDTTVGSKLYLFKFDIK